VVIAQFGSCDEAKQDQFFEKKWCRSQFAILLAEGHHCGYTTIEDREDDIYVHELVVHPLFQGQGIGSAFLR